MPTPGLLFTVMPSGETVPGPASFHSLTKLSWHDAHFRLIPKNTCATFCENCISFTWLAFTLPRHLIPLMNPSDSFDGAINSRTNAS